ncbi:MAG: hypothetical protein U9O96_06190 [Candidatus Thermoplasmatota archaeon]|nr:hypothetical protein [Candidatus Thermoplasmatota archaeon]
MKRKGASNIIMSAGIVALLIMTACIPVLASGGDDKGTVECSISNIMGTNFEKKSLPSEKIKEMEAKIVKILSRDEESVNISETMGQVIEVLKDYGIFSEKDGFINFIFDKKEWGWGIFNYVVSYGRGEIYIPLKSDRSFIRMMFRPIFFKYNLGVTITKFGSNYIWDSKNTMSNMGWMFGRQRGFTVGFVGLHIRVPHKLSPDSHLFIGTSLIINGNNLLF